MRSANEELSSAPSSSSDPSADVHHHLHLRFPPPHLRSTLYHNTRMPSSPSADDASPNQVDEYSPHFGPSARANLILRSSDGTLFATKKCHLEAASPVFEDIFELGAEGEERDGKPLVQLQETAEELEPFLRLLQRDKFTARGEELAITVDLLVKVSPLVEKYQTSHLAWVLYERCLPALLVPPEEETGPVAGHTATLLALAIIHSKEAAARTVLRDFKEWLPVETGASVLTHSRAEEPEARFVDHRYDGIEDIPLVLLGRMPVKAIRDFALLHRKVSTRTDYSWLNAADDFKVRLTASFSACFNSRLTHRVSDWSDSLSSRSAPSSCRPTVRSTSSFTL